MLKIETKNIYNALLELNVVPKEKLDEGVQLAKDDTFKFYDFLLDNELISDEHLGQLMADILDYPYVNLEQVSIPRRVISLIPEVVARKRRAIPFELDADGLKLAMEDPQDSDFISFVGKKVGVKVSPHFTTPRVLSDALTRYRVGLQEALDKLLQQQVSLSDNTISPEAPIAKVVDTLIDYAYQNKASDVHIEPEEGYSVVRFRVDGVLHDVMDLRKELHHQVISRIKVMSRLRTDEHMMAQDGKMRIKLQDEFVDIRVSIVPIIEGEKCVMRLLSGRTRQFGLPDLGMGEKDLAIIEEAYERPHGMILATGPTGSGKTTSIYAILKQLNVRDVNIATIEDPVEYDIEGVSQIQVNNKTNLTFAQGLRSILRQDPDIIFVGEIRDKETASIATNSAMTGHLVLSTLHTNDAATTLPRLIDMEIEPFLVASTVNVIVAQRLVRKICEKCRVSENIPRTDVAEKVSAKLLKKYFGSSKTIRTYKGKGCEVCHGTGYTGRIGVFEVMKISPKIRELIIQKANSDVITQQAVKDGMTPMFEDGIIKIAQGLTTFDEIFRVTKD